MSKNAMVVRCGCGSQNVVVRDRYKCTLVCNECTSIMEVPQNVAEFYSAIRELSEKGIEITVIDGEVFAADKWGNKHSIGNVMFFNGKSEEEIVDIIDNYFMACCE